MKRELTEEQQTLLHKAGKHYAAAYLLATIAVDQADDGDEACRRLGLMRNEIKMNANRVQRAFTVFCDDFRKYIAKGDANVILSDWERLSEKIGAIIEDEL